MIPAELVSRPAWVSWKFVSVEGSAKPTKVPFNPHFGYEVDVSRPENWVSYEATVNGTAHNYNGNGFCLHRDDPYSFIDLDDPFRRSNGTWITEADGTEFLEAQELARQLWSIVTEMQSYAELSPSGRGVHIIVRGKLPANIKRGKVEIYSFDRYMTMTGHHIPGTPHDIQDRQYMLEQLAEKIGGLTTNIVQHESSEITRTDEAVIQACFAASTADKFAALWSGDLSSYSSGSEADQALANYICYQTDNAEQAERLFRMSGHFASREKLQGSRGPYLVNRVIQKGFDQKPQPIDFDALRQSSAQLRANLADNRAQREPVVQTVAKLRPEGLMGLIGDFIYDAAPRPVDEIAVAGAIGLMAGVCGRAYNYKGTGLGQYVVCVAHSGTGKEAIASGISKLINSVTDAIPAAHHFLGPSRISSGAALYKQFGKGSDGKSPSFLSVLPEFGHTLAAMTDPRASENQLGLRQALLDVYTKSGQGQIVGAQVYSDKDKNVAGFTAPGFSFVGDTTPGIFYDSISNQSIIDGLIPRFLLIEYDGARVPLNELAYRAEPSPALIYQLKMLMEQALALNAKDQVIQVQATEAAEEALRAFNSFCDEKHNRTPHEVGKAVWARAYLKAAKLAALVAVGRNWLEPVIEPSDVEYGKAFSVNDAVRLLGRIDTGDITTEKNIDNGRHTAVLRYFRSYLSKQPAKAYNVPPNYWENSVMPLSLITAKATKNKLFAGAHKSSHEMIVRTLNELIANGHIASIKGDQTILAKLGVVGNPRGDAYVLIDPNCLNNLGDE